jgi:hypothetical protein
MCLYRVTMHGSKDSIPNQIKVFWLFVVNFLQSVYCAALLYMYYDTQAMQ